MGGHDPLWERERELLKPLTSASESFSGFSLVHSVNLAIGGEEQYLRALLVPPPPDLPNVSLGSRSWSNSGYLYLPSFFQWLHKVISCCSLFILVPPCSSCCYCCCCCCCSYPSSFRKEEEKKEKKKKKKEWNSGLNLCDLPPYPDPLSLIPYPPLSSLILSPLSSLIPQMMRR